MSFQREVKIIRKVDKWGIEGQCIFASRWIEKGNIIGHAYDLIGEVNGKYIAGEITVLGVVHNHSLRPNAKPIIKDNKIYFEALKHINEDSEITCNYNDYSNILNIEKPSKEWQENNYEN